jgi:hypothetical protein
MKRKASYLLAALIGLVIPAGLAQPPGVGRRLDQAASESAGEPGGIPNPSTTNLPPRTLPEGLALRSPVNWVQTDLLAAHLPPADWRQIEEFVEAGYQVVTVNTLAQWDRVGPGAADYDPTVVQQADAYLRRFVSLVHGAGAKAVFYLGPVQSPLHSPVFRAKHPGWLRVNEDGSRASDYVNFRNPEVVAWLTDQLAALVRQYQADGFWFDGYSPVALHTYDPATRKAFADVEIMLRCLEGAPWGVYAEFVEPTGRERHLHVYAKEVKARMAWWKESETIPYVGLVASEQTRLLLGRDTLPEYFSHTLGAFRALFEAHLPLRVLSEYDLEAADLQGVRVLVLPDVRVLSARSAEVVRRFVEAGGGLIATRGTSLYDETLKQRPNFSLADVLGADYAGNYEVTSREAQLSLWLEAPDHPILNDEAIQGQERNAWRNPTGPPPARAWLDLVASATLTKPRGGGLTLVSLRTNQSAAFAYPAMIASSYGRGRVVYAPAGLDQAMFFYPNTYIRAMLVNACQWVAQDARPPLEVDGPRLLAVTYRRQPAQKRTIVHLLNDQSSYGRHSLCQKLLRPNSSVTGPWAVREEVIPLHDVRVRCRVPGVTQATQEPENLNLPLRPLAEGGVEVLVPKLELYSLVVFE